MNRKMIHMAAFVLLLMTMLCGCGRKMAASDTAGGVLNEASANTAEPAELSDEQALSAIRNYCLIRNPDLEDIVNAEEYPVYWEVSSSDEHEIVILFRSYTGSQNRYYMDRLTGDTYVTEFVPGITDEEQRSDESFNARDYLGD